MEASETKSEILNLFPSEKSFRLSKRKLKVGQKINDQSGSGFKSHLIREMAPAVQSRGWDDLTCA